MMLVHELLARAAAQTPDAIAVVEPGASITYADLHARAAGVATALIDAGVGHGDRVILALPNSIEFVSAYFGILAAGAIAVPLPSGPRSDRLPKATADCAPAASLVDSATWPAVASCRTGHSAITFVVARSGSPVPAGARNLPALDRAVAPAAAGGPPAPPRQPGDTATIIYTSGSTGTPLGVELSHGNIISNTTSIVDYLALTPSDRVMVVLPFYYVYGLSLLHTHVAVGGCLVIDNRSAFPNQVLQSMRAHAVTGFAGVPSTFALLLHRSNLATTPLPALRYVTQAGGAMPPARIQEWLRLLPDVPFFVMYGATEASARLTYLPPDEVRRRPGSIGRAIPRVDMRIVRDDGTEAGTGEVGELVAQGPNIAKGYWNRPDETGARFHPDGFHTGDLGYADADGFLYLVGRRSDMLKVGAHRVSPLEIEEALHEHPAVHEAAVIGAPDDILGEVAVAFVVLRGDHRLDARELVLFARGRLPEHKVPARIELVDDLPKTAAGKIDKRALHATAGALS